MAFACIEVFFKEPRVIPPVFIKDMRINLGDHGGLGVTGVTLYGFYITAVKLQLVCDAGMTKAVENNLWQIMLIDQARKSLLDDRGFPGRPAGGADDQVVIEVFVSEIIFRVILLAFEIHKHPGNGRWQEYLTDAALRFRGVQRILPYTLHFLVDRNAGIV